MHRYLWLICLSLVLFACSQASSEASPAKTQISLETQVEVNVQFDDTCREAGHNYYAAISIREDNEKGTNGIFTLEGQSLPQTETFSRNIRESYQVHINTLRDNENQEVRIGVYNIKSGSHKHIFSIGCDRLKTIK